MTLDEARARIGHKVAYRDYDYNGMDIVAVLTEGVITSVNDRYVFVRYGADMHSKATRPEDLSAVP